MSREPRPLFEIRVRPNNSVRCLRCAGSGWIPTIATTLEDRCPECLGNGWGWTPGGGSDD
jgi:hypothetical protein